MSMLSWFHRFLENDWQDLIPLLSSGSVLLGATMFGKVEKSRQRVDSKYGFASAMVSNPRSAQESALAQEIERLRIVLSMATAINSTLNYERVLKMALDIATQAFASSEAEQARIKSAVLLFEKDRLRVASARGLSHSDWRQTMPAQQGILADSLNHAQIRVCQNPPQDPELRYLTAFHLVQNVVCVPLAIGLKVYGLMLFGHPQPNYFEGDRLQLLETIAHQAMVALQNARLYRELEEEKERIMEIQDDARKKLARDLHDGPTQAIAAIAMRVNFARRLMERDSDATAEELFKIETLARQTTKEIRQMLFTLRPLILESQGLKAALGQLAVKVADAHDQVVMVEAEPDVEKGIDPNKQGTIFAVAEEAINNARKHAQAETIWVRLKRHGNMFLLEVEDDGIGFNLGSIDSGYENRGSLGLVNMRERADLINALLEMESKPGRGTKVTLAVPLTSDAAEYLHRPSFATSPQPMQSMVSHH